jgi:AcrR family transcriptional regulator
MNPPVQVTTGKSFVDLRLLPDRLLDTSSSFAIMTQGSIFRGKKGERRMIVAGANGRRTSDGRRELKKAVTRRELILAGRELFSRKGLYESRIEDLTRHAGIAKGTLYQYFSDKDELIQEVVAMGFAELDGKMQRRTRGSESLGDLAERVAAVHLEFFLANPDLMRVFHQVRGLLKFNHRRWRPLQSTLSQHVQRIADLVGQTPLPAKLSQARRWELAIQIFGAVSGIVSVNATIDPRVSLRLRPRAVSQGLAAMVLASTGSSRALPHRPSRRSTTASRSSTSARRRLPDIRRPRRR